MEQNELLPETAETIHQTENAAGDGQIESDGAAEVVAEQTDAPVEENSPEAAENQELPNITGSQATIKIEGQEIELEAVLAQDDKLLKTILQPHFAAIENANITREVKDGKLTVTIVKRAQHKGFEAGKAETETPFEILCAEPEEINPAIILAEELMRRDVAAGFDFDNFDAITETLNYSRAEIGVIERHLDALAKTPGAASAIVPIGF